TSFLDRGLLGHIKQ
ncbi:unnamed protein product, partial [Allacma fusca]